MLLSPSCQSEVMNTCPFQLVKLPTCIQEHLRNYKTLIKLLCMKTLIGLDVTNMSQKFLFTTFILRTRTFGSLLTRHTLFFFVLFSPPPPPPGLFLQHTFVNLNWWKVTKPLCCGRMKGLWEHWGYLLNKYDASSYYNSLSLTKSKQLVDEMLHCSTGQQTFSAWLTRH